MKRYINIVFCAALIVALMLSPSFAALTVDVNFTDTDLQAALGGPAGPVATELINELSKYSDVPDLARGFGNANTYASHAGTLRGYQNYDLFAISVGGMVSVQAPGSDPNFLADVQDEMEDGDVYAGVGVTPLVVQAGINLDFLFDGLYVTFLFGKLHTNISQGNFRIDHNANMIGGHVNYALIGENAILGRSLLWRGLTVQTGFIHTDNRLKFFNELDEIDGGPILVAGTYNVLYMLDPSVNFVLETRANIIPVEVYTSIRFLWALNLGVGAGFDYVLSSRTDFGLASAGDVEITDDGVGGVSGLVGEKGKISVNADTTGIESDRYRPKLMANFGLSAGPVFIDIPVSYYLDNGYSLGLTAGFAW